jgi:hypothetical protein
MGGGAEGRHGWLRAAAFYVACNLPVAIAFLVLLFKVVRVQQSAALTDYWDEYFVDLRHPWVWPLWFGRRMFSLCNYACQPGGFLLLPAMILGVIALWRARDAFRLTALAGPILVTLVAAAAQRYPLDGSRLNTFLTPPTLLLTAVGLEWLFAAGRPRWPAVAALAMGGFVLAAAVGSAAYHLAVPRLRAHLRPVARYVAAHAHPADDIYALDEREFACYWPAGDARVHPWVDRSDRMPRRFWIVWSFNSRDGRDRIKPILAWAEAFAAVRAEYVGIGGSAYLLERADPAPPPPVNPPSILKQHKKLHPAADEAPEP